MKVLKFGGSSVATPAAIRAVTEIVRRAASEGPVAVVVSALGGVTDDLERAADGAALGRSANGQNGANGETGAADDGLARLRQRHHEVATAVVDSADRAGLEAEVDRLLAELEDLLHGVYLLREASPRARDSILSYGERLSCQIVAAALRAAGVPARPVSTRRLIVTDDSFGRAQVDLEASLPRIREAVEGGDEIAVLTGFLGATRAGEITTLGRGGSDYTAALVGAALGASAVELWTDVDGVMSADPRLVPAAAPIAELSYAELMELSHFGAGVVYPPSVHPARRQGIPLWIKNTFAPEVPGTRVSELPGVRASHGDRPIRGVTSVSSVELLRLEGDGLAAVPGMSGRLFGALARAGVSVILISQASSKHSICFAVHPNESPAARRAVEDEFALERRVGLVDPLVEEELSVLAVVGEGMRERTGLAGRLFGVLGEHGVNIRVITQGSSELNITVAVERDDERRALTAIHRAFFAPPRRRLEIAVAGVGQVGSALLGQLSAAAPGLAETERLEIAVVAVADSRRVATASAGSSLPLDTWRTELDRAADDAPTTERWLEILGHPSGAARVLVDCTASEAPVAAYAPLLARGVSVVAANKRGFAGPLERWQEIEAAAGGSSAAGAGAGLYHEATVGAGLPVVSTLRDLVATGDRVERIDGVLSGTLGFVLDRVGRGVALSLAVREACEAGYAEPHPGEDLAGLDVARKLLVLGRLAGWPLAPEAVAVEPIAAAAVPGAPECSWAALPLEDLWRRLPELDAPMAERARRAAKEGRRLLYVGSVTAAGGRVGIEAVGAEHPCFGVSGPDSLVAFTTRRYAERPLVVQGPGAGPEVTAAGVFADLLRAARRTAEPWG